ncbi:MAG: amino acid ABC transporter substrate-binding protein [Phascolarctobacterium sp.]|nr:amino acid ABC transporter substrate-binding protein [Phascolarctobacterium sp.]
MKFGKKLAAVLTLAVMGMAIVGCGGGDKKAEEKKAAAPAKPAQKIVIGLDDNFAPMGFRDKDNKIVGMDIDLAREACKRLNMEAEFKPIDWGAKEAEIKSKRIDMIWNCFTVNPEREKTYGLTKPYITNAQMIVVPVDSKIASKADLAGKRVAVQDDSTGSYLLELPKNKALKDSLKDYRKYPEFASIYLELDNKRVDVAIVDAVLAGYYDKKNPGKYKILKENMGEEVVAVAFRKEDKELIAKVDKVLDEMKKDGTCKKVSEKWLGIDITKYDAK